MLWVFLIFITSMSSFSCKEKHQNIKVIFYHHGQETTLDPELSGFWNLIKTAEDLLITADGMMRLAVEPELINKIKREERVIEIIYPKPVELNINRNKLTIHPDRLLIPLSGELVGEGENPQAVIFHGYPAYSAGPYTNRKGIGELEKILHEMGVK